MATKKTTAQDGKPLQAEYFWFIEGTEYYGESSHPALDKALESAGKHIEEIDLNGEEVVVMQVVNKFKIKRTLEPV